MPLGAVDFRNPFLWAILIGWIMSVVIHEFAHGLVGYWAGDYTIRERGGLSFNPLQYVDPLMSIVLPAVFLLMGGIPLPGGVTYVRRDLIKSRIKNSLVSLAGPASNFLIFLACALPLHPRFGWLNPDLPMSQAPAFQVFLAAMAVLQLLAVILNLIPVPPLDGFQMVSPFLPREVRQKVMQPPMGMILFVGYFFILSNSHVMQYLFQAIFTFLHHLGFGIDTLEFFRRSYNTALFGASD